MLLLFELSVRVFFYPQNRQLWLYVDRKICTIDSAVKKVQLPSNFFKKNIESWIFFSKLIHPSCQPSTGSVSVLGLFIQTKQLITALKSSQPSFRWRHSSGCCITGNCCHFHKEYPSWPSQQWGASSCRYLAARNESHWLLSRRQMAHRITFRLLTPNTFCGLFIRRVCVRNTERSGNIPAGWQHLFTIIKASQHVNFFNHYFKEKAHPVKTAVILLLDQKDRTSEDLDRVTLHCARPRRSPRSPSLCDSQRLNVPYQRSVWAAGAAPPRSHFSHLLMHIISTDQL